MVSPWLILAFDLDSIGTCSRGNQETIMQNQAVQGRVPGTLDQQGKHIHDPGIHTEDQGLARS